MSARKVAPTSAPATTQRVAGNKASVSRMRCASSTFSLDSTAADGRFLIFAEGTIKTDFGTSIMTPEAGAAVIKTFRERGNDMPIDLRHGMVKAVATLEESLAYGWIPCPNGLQYVKGKGLYANGVQWDPRVEAALRSKPPQLKYHSPAYDQDSTTKVISSLDNIALTNMPATWSLTRMAAEKRRTAMDLAKLGMALIAATNGAESGDESCVAIRDALIDALGDQVDAAVEAAQSMMAAPESQELAAAAEPDVSAGAAEPDMAAAAAEPEVKAESDKAEGVTAEALLLMARGAENKTIASRDKVLAENAHLIPKNPALQKMLRAVPDKVLAEFLAGRKADTSPTVIRQGQGQARTIIAGKKPEARPSTGDVPEDVKAEATCIARKTGTDTKKVLAELMAARAEQK